MDEISKIGESSLAALFFQVDGGSEQNVVQELRKLNYTNVYKVFGRYDILSLFDIKHIEDERLYISCDGVAVSRAVVAYSFSTDSYQSPSIAEWTSGSSILGFIFLELDKWFYSPESGEDSSLSAYLKVISFLKRIGNTNNIELAIYGGYGISELYIIVKTENIKDIWKITNACRNVIAKDCFSITDAPYSSLPVFAKTHTIPCLSWDSIDIDDNTGNVNINGVNGRCEAAISISCHPGFENYVEAYFPIDEGFHYAGLLGADDGIIVMETEIETQRIIKKIISFRAAWAREHNSPITTCTLFKGPLDNLEEVDCQAIAYRVLNDVYVKIDIPEILQKNNQRLANRIKNFEHNINSYYCNRAHQVAVSSIVHYMQGYVAEQVKRYARATKNSLYRTFAAESKLLEAIETAENGLAQRVGSNFGSPYFGYEIPLPFGDGIFASLVAIEYLINHIFVDWSDHHPAYKGKSSGNGFPTFNDSYGFLMRWGETLNLPLTALYDPCSSRGNWLTLTHEISHSIYIRLNLGITEEKALNKIRSKYFKDRSAFIKYDDVFIDQVFELFAHWYDYHHFYNQDFDLYLDQIWKSWLLIPVVHTNFTEYLFRSLFVYLIRHHEEIKKAKKTSVDAYAFLVKELWDKHLLKLRPIIDQLPQDYKDNIEGQEQRIKLLKLFFKYYPIIKIFKKYQNDEFKDSINAIYENLDQHVERIIDGKLIKSGIVNPYALVKNVIVQQHNQGDLRAATTLIMSLKNMVSFYEESDKKEQL